MAKQHLQLYYRVLPTAHPALDVSVSGELMLAEEPTAGQS